MPATVRMPGVVALPIWPALIRLPLMLPVPVRLPLAEMLTVAAVSAWSNWSRMLFAKSFGSDEYTPSTAALILFTWSSGGYAP